MRRDTNVCSRLAGMPVEYREEPCRSALNKVRGMMFEWSLNPLHRCARLGKPARRASRACLFASCGLDSRTQAVVTARQSLALGGLACDGGRSPAARLCRAAQTRSYGRNTP